VLARSNTEVFVCLCANAEVVVPLWVSNKRVSVTGSNTSVCST